MLSVRNVDTLQAIEWFKQGWQLFMSNPSHWALMAAIFGGIVLVLSVLPFIGPLVLNLLVPVLSAGMLKAVYNRYQEEDADLMDIFSSFQDQEKLKELLIVGALMLLSGFAAAILSSLFVGDAIKVEQVVGMPSLNPSMASLLFMLIISLAMAMLFVYAPALVVFKGMKGVDAVKASFQGAWANVLPFIIFVLIYVVLAFIASIPFMLGFLVLLPVMAGAVFAGYKDIFE